MSSSRVTGNTNSVYMSARFDGWPLTLAAWLEQVVLPAHPHKTLSCKTWSLPKANQTSHIRKETHCGFDRSRDVIFHAALTTHRREHVLWLLVVGLLARYWGVAASYLAFAQCWSQHHIVISNRRKMVRRLAARQTSFAVHRHHHRR